MPQTVVTASKQPTIVSNSSSTLDSLPKQFVTAMRTLFDIMDDKHTGYVNFADIEHRWQDDGTKGLPKGVIESLQKVTPPNGMLSFERFCAGLKICLLRNQVEKTSSTNVTTHISKQRSVDNIIVNGNNSNQPIITNRPPSAPLLDIDCTTPKSSHTNITTSRPNMSQQRTLSMPQLLSERNKENLEVNLQLEVPNQQRPINKPPQLYGPPKPPRVGLVDKSEIRTALQNWQMGLMINDQEAKDKRTTSNGTYNGNNGRTGRGAGDGKPATQMELQSQQQPQQQQQVVAGVPNVVGGGGVVMGLYQKKANVRRREPRRHTLQNGIDYNMLKRMKQIEQEKDVLMQGLSAIEKARDWYLKQVANVQDKMKYLGRMGSHMEQWSETQQERLELQRARVLEVNRHLATLTCSWERGGLPLHMNLAVHHVPQHIITSTNQQHQDNMLNRLKQQNHLLTEEVSKKSERITVLEREKAALIRELLQMRAQPRTNTNTQLQQEEAVF